MDVISAARQLGEVLQADPAYIRFAKATLDSENNAELQDKIGQFNIKRMNLDNELSKEEKDEEAVKSLNEQLRELYNEIMAHPVMAEYNEARQGVDKILADINSIITMCAQGADPKTCEISNCTGNCSGCSGCH